MEVGLVWCVTLTAQLESLSYTLICHFNSSAACWVKQGRSVFITKTNITQWREYCCIQVWQRPGPLVFHLTLSFPWLLQEGQKLYSRASCAADSVDSVSTDKSNWVLMSTSRGNVPALIAMTFLGHFLPLMKPSCHVSWMIPCYNQIHGGWTNKLETQGESNSCRSLANVFPALPALWCHSLRQAYRCLRSKTLQPNRLNVSYWEFIISWKIDFRL